MADRMEEAFRNAFVRADEVDFEPLDVTAIQKRPEAILGESQKARTGRTFGAVRALAAVAAFVLVAGVGWFFANRLAGSTSASMVAPQATPGGGTPLGNPTLVPDPGMKYVSFANVAIQVPAQWGFASTIEPWCVAGERPTMPYVDQVDPVDEVSPAIECDGVGPAEGTVTHLTWRYALAEETEASTTPLRTGWADYSQRVGEAWVTVQAPTSDARLAATILATGRAVDVDHNGCPATGRIQANDFIRPLSGDLVRVGRVDEIAVCQYEVGAGTSRPGLKASRNLTGDAALELLTQLRNAPAGAGPNDPSQCIRQAGPEAITLRLRDGNAVTETYVYYQGCQGNGILDSVAVRTLTTGVCTAILGDQVTYQAGWLTTYQLCHSVVMVSAETPKSGTAVSPRATTTEKPSAASTSSASAGQVTPAAPLPATGSPDPFSGGTPPR